MFWTIVAYAGCFAVGVVAGILLTILAIWRLLTYRTGEGD